MGRGVGGGRKAPVVLSKVPFGMRGLLIKNLHSAREGADLQGSSHAAEN